MKVLNMVNKDIIDVSEIQDKRLASVMDTLDDDLIEVPENISNKGEFYSWIQAH